MNRGLTLFLVVMLAAGMFASWGVNQLLINVKTSQMFNRNFNAVLQLQEGR